MSAREFRNYLIPEFGRLCLRDLRPNILQRYFSNLAVSSNNEPLSYESRDKIRDVLSGALRYALQNDWLVKNPAEQVRVPPDKRGRKRSKPYVTPQQFEALIDLIREPYATMVYVAIYTGLRVSELVALKWNDVKAVENVNEVEPRYTISIDERYCRGDWGAPKSEASNATIGINACVYRRIQALRSLVVEVRAGRAIRKYKVVKSEGPNDLIFQSLQKCAPMRDNNILTRHIKPAARKIGLDFVNWRCLRTSHATWLKMPGADVKDAQGPDAARKDRHDARYLPAVRT